MDKNILSFYIFIVSVAFLVSCKENKEETSSKDVSGKLNFGVLRYDSAALEYRLDSIHNRGLIVQFIQLDAANNDLAFQAISYAYDTLNDFNNSWMPDTLALVKDSLPKTFSGKITIGNNEITREQLYNVVRDEKGQRFSYDYLLFTPVVEGVFNHVVYLLTPVKNNRPVPGAFKQMSSPMPPSRVWEE